MPRVKEVTLNYKLGCSVQPKAFHSLSYSEVASMTVDMTDTDGTFGTAKKMLESIREGLSEVVDQPVMEFWDTAGGTREKEE